MWLSAVCKYYVPWQLQDCPEMYQEGSGVRFTILQEEILRVPMQKLHPGALQMFIEPFVGVKYSQGFDFFLHLG
jgi:hypothetical protein